ncbi:cytochrome c oxidase assembly protein [Oceanibacterium hippocampi]|uniref:Cytochrome c oxidase assembly protein CtaG n=1 Tax=Oceanibacterium hippocampi TaxID=745714 RepID=A0A1Y5S830_9PROT|nr:cytochrome c oxidase assembly protein [Oceanibacterium hippocampi]SLN33269.1 Cytochrome c oxidase assembly protein CtaG [Oceanibacterium hippocampi]
MSNRRNRVVVTGAVAAVVGMVCLAYASVPLYDLFCRVTGFGGTTQRADAAPEQVIDRAFTVHFDASLARGMPWSFRPLQRSVDVEAGEQKLAFFQAHNPTPHRVSGNATFNVTPQKIGKYFNKIECFCFTEQTLEPGETVDMPILFFIDPAIADDPNAAEVKTITLSYTFFVDEDAESELKDGKRTVSQVQTAPASRDIN